MPGCYLTGSMQLAKDEAMKRVSQCPMILMIVTDPNAGSGSGSGSKKSSKNQKSLDENFDDRNSDRNSQNSDRNSPEICSKLKFEQMQEAIRDLKISWLQKLDTANSGKLYAELIAESAENLETHVQRLKNLTEKNRFLQNSSAIFGVVFSIRGLIDSDALLKYFGQKNSLTFDSISKKRKRYLTRISKFWNF